MTVEGGLVTRPPGVDDQARDQRQRGQARPSLTDDATTLAGAGWYAELLVSSDDPPTTVTVTKFEVRVLP